VSISVKTLCKKVKTVSKLGRFVSLFIRTKQNYFYTPVINSAESKLPVLTVQTRTGPWTSDSCSSSESFSSKFAWKHFFLRFRFALSTSLFSRFDGTSSLYYLVSVCVLCCVSSSIFHLPRPTVLSLEKSDLHPRLIS
jgi:hypothetical protein